MWGWGEYLVARLRGPVGSLSLFWGHSQHRGGASARPQMRGPFFSFSPH